MKEITYGSINPPAPVAAAPTATTPAMKTFILHFVFDVVANAMLQKSKVLLVIEVFVMLS